jgi:glycosyltransferase involved in cell wall biosynthesis
MGVGIGDFVMSVKRVLRPLVPDRLMARYRLRQHSNAARVNVDVVLEHEKAASRWLATTPDTYRVIDPAVLADATTEFVAIGHPPADGWAMASATGLLSRKDIGAALVGEVAAPRLIDRRRAEPVVAPVTMVLRPEVLGEVGEPPGGDLAALLARVRDAGHRIGLVPVEPSGAESLRHDPIDADPVVILAAVPLHDVGGGSRGAQLAFELVGRGYHVTYVYLYPSYEDVDLGLRYVHPLLEQVRFDRFVPGVHVERTEGRPGVVLLELPSPRYQYSAFTLSDAGWSLVYDIIDDWADPALGGDWYDPTLESSFIRVANVVVASAPDLVERARAAGATATLVPNAVNASLFSGQNAPWPDDLPEGPIIGYHGSLYGDWFDWEAVRTIAERHPRAAVVLIGEARGVPSEFPSNVRFLGLKPQHDLPAYVRQFDVGMVPFTLSKTTHAVSPLKVYEYLASGVPVAAPPLRALEGLEGVYTDPDLSAAVDRAMEARRPDPSVALAVHAWGSRVEAIFSALGRDVAGPTDHPVKVVVRPAVHYARRERRVG